MWRSECLLAGGIGRQPGQSHAQLDPATVGRSAGGHRYRATERLHNTHSSWCQAMKQPTRASRALLSTRGKTFSPGALLFPATLPSGCAACTRRSWPVRRAAAGRIGASPGCLRPCCRRRKGHPQPHCGRWHIASAESSAGLLQCERLPFPGKDCRGRLRRRGHVPVWNMPRSWRRTKKIPVWKVFRC
jgi:hypothetical protein